jgi:hypothetical protein
MKIRESEPTNSHQQMTPAYFLKIIYRSVAPDNSDWGQSSTPIHTYVIVPEKFGWHVP